MKLRKVTPDLKSVLSGAGSGEMLDVVLELESPGEPVNSHLTPREKMDLLREEFFKSMTPIEDKIHEVGGKVLGSAWINNTVRARVPAKGISELTKLKSVDRVDVPRALMRENS